MQSVVGQAVVQFAQGTRDSRAYAVKFFLDEASFYAEAAMYVAVFPNLREWLSERAVDAMAHLAKESEITSDKGDIKGQGGGAEQAMQAAGARFLPQVRCFLFLMLRL